MIWNPWKEIKRLREIMYRNNTMACDDYYTIEDLRDALLDIARLETPRCSRGVQKAVNIAREALNK